MTGFLRSGWLGRVTGIAVAVCLVWMLARDASRIGDAGTAVTPGVLLMSAVLSLLGHALNMGVWILLARAFSLGSDARISCRAWIRSRLGRYVPGKVPMLLIRHRAYPDASLARVTLATVTEQAASLAAAAALVLAGILAGGAEIPGVGPLAAAGAVLLMLAVLHPAVIRTAANPVLRVLHRPPLEDLPPYRILLAASMAYTIPALVHGMSLFVLLKAMIDLAPGSYLTVTAAYFGASIAGLLVLVAPAGLGVREGLVVLFLGGLAPRPVLASATLLMRLVYSVTELVLFAAAGLGRATGGSRRTAEPACGTSRNGERVGAGSSGLPDHKGNPDTSSSISD
jgi:glycosyltransferase 2 family protein